MVGTQCQESCREQTPHKLEFRSFADAINPIWFVTGMDTDFANTFGLLFGLGFELPFRFDMNIFFMPCNFFDLLTAATSNSSVATSGPRSGSMRSRNTDHSALGRQGSQRRFNSRWGAFSSR